MVLGRPTTAVDRQTAVLWGVIAAIATAGLLAAALVAVGLARWVSRPLSELEMAAQEFGDGDLSTRASAETGPIEVRRLAASFNLMAGRLESLVRGHQATMADVSHQLRTPLAALRLRLDLLAQDSDAAAAAEVAGAQEEIARLSRLVNGMLAVARAENIATQQVSLPLDDVISTRVAAWLPAADERNVRLEADVEPVAARMGEGHLEQILDNLIANALDVLPGWRSHLDQRTGYRRYGQDHRRGQRSRHERAAAEARVPAVRHQQWRRHWPRPGDRRPAHGRKRRHRDAVRHRLTAG